MAIGQCHHLDAGRIGIPRRVGREQDRFPARQNLWQGKQLSVAQNPKAFFNLWTVPIESGAAGLRAGKPEVFLQTPASDTNPAFSPDGKWLAYTAFGSGTLQVYVRAFPDRGGKWQISIAGGTHPKWSRDGHELYFETLENHVMTAAYSVKGDSFVAGAPKLWSEQQVHAVDPAPGGKRMLTRMPTNPKGEQEAQNHVVFLENFFDELRRKVPRGK